MDDNIDISDLPDPQAPAAPPDPPAQLTLYCRRSLRTALKVEAKRLDISASELIRRVVSAYGIGGGR